MATIFCWLVSDSWLISNVIILINQYTIVITALFLFANPFVSLLQNKILFLFILAQWVSKHLKRVYSLETGWNYLTAPADNFSLCFRENKQTEGTSYYLFDRQSLKCF